jgi:hypothetical protein
MTDTPRFTCPMCGLVSHHPRDLEEQYCGRCGFVDDGVRAERINAADRDAIMGQRLTDPRVRLALAGFLNQFLRVTYGVPVPGEEIAAALERYADGVAVVLDKAIAAFNSGTRPRDD